MDKNNDRVSTYYLRTTALPLQSRRLAKAATAILEESLGGRERVYNIDLATAEACANVARHAYREKEPGPLEIVVTLAPPEYVTVEVVDRGIGFEGHPLPAANAKPEAEGGRGLFIMSQLADKLDIRREDDKNIVSITMYMGEKPWKP